MRRRWKACWSAPPKPAPTSPSPSSPARTAATVFRRAGSGRDNIPLPCARSAMNSISPRRSTSRAIESPDQKAETKDLGLGKAKDLAAQLSNGEWLASIPGTDHQKDQLLNCVGCHRVERIMRSKYDADGFLTQILPRMQGYVQQSLPIHPQLRPAERLMEEQGEDRIQVYRAAAEYLSTINLSTTRAMELSAENAAAPEGPRDAGDLHGIQSAARGNGAARRDGGQGRHRLVFQFRRASPRPARSQNRQGHGIPLSKTPGRFSDWQPRPARRRRGQSVARQHVPGDDREVRSEKSRNSSSGPCRPSGISTPPRSTW